MKNGQFGPFELVRAKPSLGPERAWDEPPNRNGYVANGYLVARCAQQPPGRKRLVSQRAWDAMLSAFSRAERVPVELGETRPLGLEFVDSGGTVSVVDPSLAQLLLGLKTVRLVHPELMAASASADSLAHLPIAGLDPLDPAGEMAIAVMPVKL